MKSTGAGALAAMLALLGVLSWAPTAAASPLLELVGDPAEKGGLAGRFGGASASSAYFNPAFLPSASPGMTLGVFVFADQIGIDVGVRPPGSDISVEASGAFINDDALTPVFPSPLPTAWLERGCAQDCEMSGVANAARARPRQASGSSGNTRAYIPLGIVKPLISDKFVLGFSALLPAGDFTTTTGFYNDHREQYFSNSLHPELYSDRLTAMSMALGFGSQVIDWLAVGLSFTFNLSNEANAPNFVPSAEQFDALLIDNSVKVQSTMAPHVGIVITPKDWLQLTATMHTPQSLKVKAAFSSFLPDGSEQFASKTFTHGYVPASASLGGSVAVINGEKTKLRVLAGATITDWTSYHDRHDERPDGAYEWSMVVAPTLGARLGIRHTDVMLDATYVQSPVPEQTGRTNYVDNDRISASTGIHQRFEMLGLKWRAGLSAQVHHLLQRDHVKDLGVSDPVVDEVPDAQDVPPDEKDQGAINKMTFEPVEPRQGLQTNNPGYPSLSSQGWLFGGAVTLALLFDE